MTIGSLVGIPELSAEGPARISASRPGWSELRFLKSGAQMTVEEHVLMRYLLLPGSKLRHQGGSEGVVAAVLPPASDGLLRYQVTSNGGADEEWSEAEIARVHPLADPGEQLATVAFHDLLVGTTRSGKPTAPMPWGPAILVAREALLAWSDRLWHQTGGVLALGGARIDLLPHQILTAQRVLADPQVRYLLADEVGLGKTIEAGLILQSLLAMNPGLRVLVVVPGALLSQWFLELYVKFGGRRFTMFDSERIEAHPDPWAEQFSIVSSRALEDLSPKQALRFATRSWDVVIMDECHRMHSDGVLYQRMTILSRKTPHVLLLSATPPRQHASAYLALLHLLQPDAYPLNATAEFAAKLERSRVLAKIIRGLESGSAEAASQALALLPNDGRLDELLSAEDHTAATAWLRETYVPDHRVIRHRRQALSAWAEQSGIKPLSLGLRTRHWCDYKPCAAEKKMRQALAAYRQHLTKQDQVRVRSWHWLLQLELAASAHPDLLSGLCEMRGAVLADPEGYADYALRARADETLALLLRGDGSESEVASQIAISAACVDDAQAEAPHLSALRRATSAWAKHRPQRLLAVEKALHRFWAEHPQEKVLIFTQHALALRAIFDYLLGQLGPQRVADFGAHQDDAAREASAARFRDAEDCWVMVCDALGGEGRNFQFVSMVVHYDLPWSVSAVEQRIGRVDRLGRDGEIQSLVCRPQDPLACDAAWASTLDEVVDIFTRSSSGLEFISAAIESQALEVALAEGGEGLRRLLPTLRERVTAERQLIESDDDDAFSSQGDALAAAQATAEQLHQEQTPVSACCRWQRGMGGQVRTNDDTPGKFSLRERGGDNFIEGVFSLKLAKRRPDLAFFARGHRLIDGLIDDAAAASWCSATAWRRRPSPEAPSWDGLRLHLRLHLDLAPLLSAPLPLEHLRRLLPLLPAVDPLFAIGFDGAVLDAGPLLDHLRPGFDAQAGDSIFSKGVSRSLWMQPLANGKAAGILQWQERVRQAWQAAQQPITERSRALVNEASERAHLHFARYQAVAAARHRDACERLGEAHPDSLRLQRELADEERIASLLLAALEGARLVPASASYVKVA
ncbi:MAG: DEAD/DEAH box helicase [Planctomycetota bacterium]|nr:MAG: DEAD/DEAH box helicase [Planctomycetota bacterium]